MGTVVLPIDPGLISVGLKTLNKRVHRNFHHICAANALLGTFPILHPARHCEVGGFGAVEAMIEARMISVWEGYHDLIGFLGDLKRGNETSLASA